jgi:hypothetical protein
MSRATTSGSYRIELRDLYRLGLLRKGEQISGSMNWKNSYQENISSINVFSSYLPGEDPYLRLSYTLTTYQGESINIDYRIKLLERPSNLGKGEILYFVCPTSYRLCRILYRANGSHYFKSRRAYGGDLLYTQQLSSRQELPNTKYWILEKRISNLRNMRDTNTYKGTTTKRAKLLDKLQRKQKTQDFLRFSPEFIPKKLLKILQR